MKEYRLEYNDPQDSSKVKYVTFSATNQDYEGVLEGMSDDLIMSGEIDLGDELFVVEAGQRADCECCGSSTASQPVMFEGAMTIFCDNCKKSAHL